jgi:glc operon protein GlcG
MNMSCWSIVLALPAVATSASLLASDALAEVINGKRPAAITARSFVLMRGGVPLVVGDRVVGAIGVSADTPDHDELIAKAGAAVLAR